MSYCYEELAAVAVLLGSETRSLSLVPLRHWSRSVSSWQGFQYKGSLVVDKRIKSSNNNKWIIHQTLL
jgi:hypothetical protein